MKRALHESNRGRTMIRRDFYKTLGLGALSAFMGRSAEAETAADAPASARRVLVETVSVAGLAYYDGTAAVVERLEPGDALVLRREPTNAHDARAIEVFTARGVKLGYVPHRHNTTLARLADQDIAFEAHVTRVDAEAWPYDAVDFAIHMLVTAD